VNGTAEARRAAGVCLGRSWSFDLECCMFVHVTYSLFVHVAYSLCAALRLKKRQVVVERGVLQVGRCCCCYLLVRVHVSGRI
jgi:hypothetical protein